MKTLIRTRKQRGQGMTEYIIIVALVAVAAIGAYSWFGKSVRDQTAGLAQEVSGVDAQAEIADAKTSATKASEAGKADKGLGNYNDLNNHH
jgi:Flp pilus assembly pilin Flp